MRETLETGFLKLTFATNPRNRVSLDNLCHQQTNVIETRFLAPVSCAGFFFAEVEGSQHLKRLETGFLCRGWWGGKGCLKKPGFLSLGRPRNRVINVNLCHKRKNIIETRFLVPGARNLERLETGFLCRGLWGGRDFLEKPGFLSLGLETGFLCRGWWGGKGCLKKPGFLSLGFLVPGVSCPWGFFSLKVILSDLNIVFSFP
ncbi:hypothetical protein [Planktothricoides sp. SR001]|uniref:hypothetical protein n=1 Tax=Planktothricoides sp. SR001 TaxID=1705388 RepID=UPI0012E14E05|nr:hypothetical protein [Planktothricoides sp. SR001]